MTDTSPKLSVLLRAGTKALVYRPGRALCWLLVWLGRVSRRPVWLGRVLRWVPVWLGRSWLALLVGLVWGLLLFAVLALYYALLGLSDWLWQPEQVLRSWQRGLRRSFIFATAKQRRWRVFEFGAILVALAAFFLDLAWRYGMEQASIQEARINTAWEVLTRPAPGQSGKAEAMETLFLAGVPMNGIDLHWQRMDVRSLCAQVPRDEEKCPQLLDPNKPETWRLQNRVDLSFLKANARKTHWSHLGWSDVCLASLWDGNCETRLDLRQAQLQGAHLDEAQLQGADLSGAVLKGAVLWGTQLQGVDLLNAQLQGADLRGAQLQGADLNRAQLQGANLWGAQLQNVYLHAAQLQGAYLHAAQLQGANLALAQLQGAYLYAAQLQGANLWRGQLQGARVSGANFCDVIFSESAFVAGRTLAWDHEPPKGWPAVWKAPIYCDSSNRAWVEKLTRDTCIPVEKPNVEPEPCD